jgi:uncharacterized LabA/DUF88 family protein
MFKARTKQIADLVKKYPKSVKQIKSLIGGKINIYIDYANVRPWANRLNWHIDLKRLHRFLTSFQKVQEIKFYYGTLKGNKNSESLIKEVNKIGYNLRTKPVKIMNIPIDTTSIDMQSTALLKNFIRPALLKKLDIETIELLNKKLRDMNRKKIYKIEDMKCNFDVEIGTDILVDYNKNGVDTFILWSGDSDFSDTIETLLRDKKKVIIFATSRVVSSELNKLKKDGLLIFDIKKIREFICWKRELKS